MDTTNMEGHARSRGAARMKGHARSSTTIHIEGSAQFHAATLVGAGLKPALGRQPATQMWRYYFYSLPHAAP